MIRCALALALFVPTVACRGPAPVEGADAAPPVAVEGAPARITLDPSLVEGGRIRLGTVARGDASEDRSFPGEVVAEAGGRAEAGALVPGRIASLEAAVGQAVKKGQVLAWVDAPEVARAAADVARARARAELAAQREARQRALDAEHATSASALEEARAEAAVARADHDAAEGLFRSLGGGAPSVGSRLAVRSPIDGVVAKRYGVVGGAVVLDRSLFEIVKRGEGAIVARIPEATTEPPREGAIATVRPRGATDPRGEGCVAVVRGDLGAIEAETRTRGFRLEPSKPCPWLVVGAFVRVDLGSAPRAAAEEPLLVPRDAIVDLKGATGVFVATDTAGQLVFRAVRVERSRGESVTVGAGLTEGERVVVVGAALVKSELLRAELVP